MDKRQDRILGQCILIGLVWLGLHLYTFFINLFDSFYYTYDEQNFLCMALYAAALLLLDVRLFRLNSRSAARSWMKYWLFCLIMTGVLFVCQIWKLELGLWALFPMAATSYAHFYPLWRSYLGTEHFHICLLALCAAHLIYFFCLMRRAGAEEKTDGPVDTGTGTME